MNVSNLHALIVLRNHAQAILNGARADLKLSKEDKSSLMNGLKKVDELFIKNFENSVDSSNVVTKSRNWTSTESEEDVLAKVLKEDSHLVKAALKGALFTRSDNAAAAAAASIKALEEQDPIVINPVDTVSKSSGAVVAPAGSEVKTLPVVSLAAESTKKNKKNSFKRV
jgi:hypothetical protein